MKPFRLFLAHSFAPERLNAVGEFDDAGGVSDFEIAELVASWIREFGNNRIEIVRTRDPFHDYLSAAVRRDISSSDGVLCLFTRRTKDCMKGLWLPSSYVISEAAAALMQFPSEEETHRRLFGLVEDGVDTEQLGMAFHGNKAAPRFRRTDRSQLQSLVRRIVEAILDERSPVALRDDREYLSIDKVVSIWRSGAVWVETRHRFRFTTEMTTVRVPHILWRVSSELPEIKPLLTEGRDSRLGFLRVTPSHCGRHEGDRFRCEIKPGDPTRWGYERNFVVECSDLRVCPGDELEYEVAWGYPNAFHNSVGNSPDQKPNSVGLRTSGRGLVRSASLTLRFERDWDGEPYRLLETPPHVYTTRTTDLPGARSPEEFMHAPEHWNWSAELRPSRRSCGAMWEVYHWATGPFLGMAKAIWTTYPNYFDDHAQGRHAPQPYPHEGEGTRSHDDDDGNGRLHPRGEGI
jgi:hypothetical protein